MKKTICRILSVSFYALSAWIFGSCLYTAFSAGSGKRMLLLCLGCAFVYFGSLLMSKTVGERSGRRLMAVSFGLFFAVYCLFLLSLTLFDRLQGRSFSSLIWRNTGSFMRYLRTSCNFIPFRYILGYFKWFFTGEIDTNTFITLFFGNICAFMPFAFFLPLFFPRTRSRKRFLVTMTVIVSAVELLQMAFNLGECDIDDVILNVGGAWALFEILHYPRIRTYIRKITNEP